MPIEVLNPTCFFPCAFYQRNIPLFYFVLVLILLCSILMVIFGGGWVNEKSQNQTLVMEVLND